jgi:peptidoglycan/LPS O-acetylase OafA/YrhL
VATGTEQENRDGATTGRAPGRFPGLDGVRGLAATLIVVHHAGFASGSTFRMPFKPFLGRADIGVAIFMVLSGFLIYRPFVARLLDGRPAPDTRSFWRRRFLRIFPAYWVALVVLLVIHGVAVRGWRGFVFSFTLTHSYLTHRAISGITQSWSLVAEIAFYALLPFWHRLTSRWVRGLDPDRAALGLLGAVTGLAAASFAFRAVIALTKPGWRTITPQWMIANADVFALGMALAVVSAWADHNGALRAACARVGRPTGRWWVAAAAVFWFTATQFDLAVGLSSSDAAREMIRQTGYAIVGFSIVAPLVLAPHASDRLRRAVDSRPLHGLGTISYGLYLWHQYFVTKVPEWAGWKIFGGHFWAIFLAAMAGGCAVATVSYFVVERPIMRVGRNAP